MKKFIILLLTAAIFFPSCASIVSHSEWPLIVESNPAGAGISIINRKGEQVFVGKTPTTVTLKSAAGFFKREEYKVKFDLAGYPTQEMTVSAKVNGWYWGNLLIGGVIGMLIVDPATGAMYKLDKESIKAEMGVKTADAATPSLRILDYRQVPASMKEKLIRINRK